VNDQPPSLRQRIPGLPGRLWQRVQAGTQAAVQTILAAARNPAQARAALRLVLNRRARLRESARNARAARRIPGPAPDAVPLGQLIQGLGERMGVLLLQEGPARAAIGVADTQFLTALWWLSSRAPLSSLRLGRERVTFRTLGFERRALAAPSVTLCCLIPGGRIASLTVEPYVRRGPGHWLSNNPENSQARALFSDLLEQPGVTPVAQVLGGPTLATLRAAQPIDAVYTWVNHADPDWAALYARHKGGSLPAATDAMSLSRFHSNDELRYSLRSLEEGLPWVRRIHVLTNCAPPPWLRTDHPRIAWVPHEAAIPAESLPTFSSHVIESCLHRIPGLADRFIYINDDVFIGQPLEPGFFFDVSGASRALLEPYGMVSGPVRAGDPDYLNAARNSAALLRDAFGFAATRLHRHTTFALRRDLLAEIEARWPEVFQRLRATRFRTARDINLTSFLYHHYGLATGQVSMAEVTHAFLKSSDIRWRAGLAAIARTDPQIICLNEGGDPPGADWHRAVRDVLAARWPVPAPWER
jgi:hypothetical protein